MSNKIIIRIAAHKVGSISALARQTGYDQSNIRLYARDTHRMPDRLIAKLARITGINPELIHAMSIAATTKKHLMRKMAQTVIKIHGEEYKQVLEKYKEIQDKN